MARPDKVATVEEVRRGFDGAAATLLTHYRGLTVAQLAELRAKLRETDAQMRVVKNTLSRRAANDAGIEGLDELLTGPVGLVFCAEDPVGPAKALKAFQADHPELVVRGGYLDGEVLDAEETIRLADLDSREDLLAKLAGLMQGALSGTARLLQAATAQQARLLQALVDAGGVEAKGFTPTASAPAEEPAAAADESAAGEPAAADEPAPAEEAADDAPEAAVADEPAEPADAPADDADAEDAPAAAEATADADDEPAASEDATAEAEAGDEPEAEAAADEAAAADDEAPAAEDETSDDQA